MAKRDLFLVVSEIRHGKKFRLGAMTLFKKPGVDGVTLEEARRMGKGTFVQEEPPLVSLHKDEERHVLVMGLDEGEALARNMLRKIENARRIIALHQERSARFIHKRAFVDKVKAEAFAPEFTASIQADKTGILTYGDVTTTVSELELVE